MKRILDRNRNRIDHWLMAPVIHLGQSYADMKYRTTLGDLAQLHYAILFKHDIEAAQQPDFKPPKGLR